MVFRALLQRKCRLSAVDAFLYLRDVTFNVFEQPSLLEDFGQLYGVQHGIFPQTGRRCSEDDLALDFKIGVREAAVSGELSQSGVKRVQTFTHVLFCLSETIHCKGWVDSWCEVSVEFCFCRFVLGRAF